MINTHLNENRMLVADSKQSEMPSEGLKKLFVEELKDIYWAEKSLADVLSKMADKVTSEELADELLDRLTLTFNQIVRLETIFSYINVKPETIKCEVMDALINETINIFTVNVEGRFVDQEILAISKKIQLHKITSYTILCAFSKSLGEIEALSSLEETLLEERSIYDRIIQLSEAFQNGEGDEDDWQYMDVKQIA